MKRTNVLPMGAMSLLLAFSACTDVYDVQNGELNRIVMTASDFEVESESRTNFKITSAGAEFTWAANDTVGIFPEEGAQAYFPMTSGAGTKSASFSGGGWALKNASVYSAYYPMVGKFYLDKKAVPVNYKGQEQTGDASTAHLGKYDYMVASPSAPKDGSVSFAFKHLGALVQLKLVLPQAASLKTVTVSSGSRVFVTEGTVDITSSSPAIRHLETSDEVHLAVNGVSATAAGQKVTLYMMLPPCRLAGETLNVTATDEGGNVYVGSMPGKDMVSGKAYAFEAEMVVGDAVTSVVLQSAGTLLDAIGGYDNLRNIEKLKIAGEINGDDVYDIRRMTNLKYLDLKNAKIVEGGRDYFLGYTTGLDKIGRYMFYETYNIEEVISPSGITEICDYAFYQDLNLYRVVFNEGLKIIGSLSFYATAISSVVLPESLEAIGDYAFSRSSLQSVCIPSGVKEIGSGAFIYGELETVTIKAHPETLTKIGSDAFRGVYETATLYIPKGTKEAYIKTELGRFLNIVEE